VQTGCRGFCAAGPLVHIEPSGVLYTHVTAADAPEILAAAQRGQVVRRLVYRDPTTDEPYAQPEESPFYRKQIRQVLEHCGNIDPERIEEYLADGGYRSLAKALSMTPEQVCKEVSDAGLRGRGGAGFPTGRKWETARQQTSDVKYVICNGDEGDPGAFMNRSLLEGDPHRVLEGMIIAGYAIGASEGIFYVRAEYPLAVQRVRKAIADAERAGLLGEDILSSGFTFHARVKEGAGAFVCGEETALMASTEGQRGMPRPKPPFPAVSGLYGKPTITNNVETLGNVPSILSHGAGWFKARGTAKSAGTKSFALTGKVMNTGLVEIPMGATLRAMIFDIGGGIPHGKRFKAVQIGGPSGGCLTEAQLDAPMDYDSLQSLGAMVGSGGLVVIDEDNCIVEMARYFMQFIQNESCGKCVACREGTKQMLALLKKIVDGKATPADLDLLEEVADVVKDASLCQLGKTASNPVLSTLRYFRSEYIAHVRDRECPAGECKAFRRFYIDPSLCKGCGRCAKACPGGAISGVVKQPYVIDQDKCARCGACVETCRFSAVEER
jgi:NADH-quinone oxidoreductase subunit F